MRRGPGGGASKTARNPFGPAESFSAEASLVYKPKTIRQAEARKAKRQATRAETTKALAAPPQKNLKTYGFEGAATIARVKSDFAKQQQLAREPKLQQAGPIKPKPLPKGFTGLTPRQEAELARAGVRQPNVPGLNSLAAGIRDAQHKLAMTPGIVAGLVQTPKPLRTRVDTQLARLPGYQVPNKVALGAEHAVVALSKPLAQYVGDIPRTLATGHQTPRQQQAGLFYTKVGEQIGKELGKDVTDHRYLNLLLDAALVGTGGTQLAFRLAAAKKALEVGEGVAGARRALATRALPQNVLPRRLVGDAETGGRRIRINEGSIQPAHQSPSIPVAAMQHLFDRLSELNPNAPLVGSISRATRIIPESQMVAARRATADLIPLKRAAHEIGVRGKGVSPREVAVSAIASFGHGPEGVALLDTDVARREARIKWLDNQLRPGLPVLTPAREERFRIERENQLSRIEALKAARPYVENPANNEALQRALALTEERSGITQAGRIERGVIEPQTAEEAVTRHARIASGAVFVNEQDAARQVRSLDRSLRRIAQRKKQVQRQITRDLRATLPSGRAANRAADLASERRAKLSAELKGLEQTEKQLARTQARLERLSSGKNLSTGDLPGLRPGMDFSAARTRALGKAYDQSVRLQRRLDRQLAARQVMESETARVPGIVEAQTVAERARSAALDAQLEQARRGDSVLGTLAQAERTVGARRDQVRTGLVGAEDVTPGPGAFFQPDVEQRPRVGVQVRSVNRPKPEKVHQSKGVLFSQGRNRLGPQTTIDDALKDLRFKEWQRQAAEAESLSKPFDREAFDPKKHQLMNPEGAKVPRYLTSEQQVLRLEDSSVKEVANAWLDARTKWVQEVFPEANPELLANAHHLGLRMIDKKLVKAISGIENFKAFADSGVLVRVLDFANNINRAALIYLNPSYIPKNFAGNLAYLHLQQISPFLVASNLRRASQRLSDLNPEILDRIVTEAGGGAARELAHEASGAFARPLERIADIQGAGADRLPRIAAWLYEADRRGYKTAAQIESLLKDESLRPVLTEVSEGAQQAMVKFGRAPLRWRRIAGKAIFIFPWIEGATRYVPRLVLDRPLSARAASGVRDRLEAYQKQVFGDAEPILRGRIPYGKPFSKYGTQVVNTINTTSLSPTGQAVSVIRAAENAARGNYADPEQLSQLIQPFVTALLESTSGIDLYNKRAFPAGQGFGNIMSQELLGTTQRPGIPLLSVLATALRNQPQYAGKTTLVPQGGWLPALEQLLLGSARPGVQVNLPAAGANARRRLGKKSGGTKLPAGGGGPDYFGGGGTTNPTPSYFE